MEEWVHLKVVATKEWYRDVTRLKASWDME
jgi:hypothetical protein